MYPAYNNSLSTCCISHIAAQVAACMGVYPGVRDCGPPSSPATASTLYNAPSMVADVVVTCNHDDYNGWTVQVQWKPSQGLKPG